MWKRILLGILISFVGLYILFQAGYYATSRPSFCGSCHEVNKYLVSWKSSAHKDLNCLECHQPRGELGKFHAKARGLNYVFQHFSGDFTIPIEAQVSDQNCLQCHLGDDKGFPDAVRMNNTKVNHYELIKKPESCLDCHRDTGHEVDIYLTPELKGAKELKP